MPHYKEENKKLRSGFTTGANSAAAAKAALIALVSGECPKEVIIPFPGKKRYKFSLHSCTITLNNGREQACASVIKDAGDDPDVTNGTEIVACVSFGHDRALKPPDCIFIGTIQLCRGKGIGYVTKPGLAVRPNEPAINPGPKKMIMEAIREVTEKPVQITLSIPKGEELAKETLNERLGVLGGLSILGTTGIVRPVSAAAWKATILTSMKVARKSGLTKIVLSTGRTSEKGGQQQLDLPEEAWAMMGDYLEFSLKSASRLGFRNVYICGMWAKVMKAALHIPQTHVRNGALEVEQAAELLAKLGVQGRLLQKIKGSNTAREMYFHLQENGRHDIIAQVCLRAREYAQDIAQVPVHLYLIGTGSEILEIV